MQGAHFAPNCLARTRPGQDADSCKLRIGRQTGKGTTYSRADQAANMNPASAAEGETQNRPAKQKGPRQRAALIRVNPCKSVASVFRRHRRVHRDRRRVHVRVHARRLHHQAARRVRDRRLDLRRGAAALQLAAPPRDSDHD